MTQYRQAAVALGLTIVEELEAGTTEGVWYALVIDYRAGGLVGGVITQDFGSCSHCDEWQAARDADERLDVAGRMLRSISWFGNPALLRAALIQQTTLYPEGDDDPLLEFMNAAIDRLRMNTWQDVYNAYVRTGCGLHVSCGREHPGEVSLATINEIDQIGREMDTSPFPTPGLPNL